MQVHVVAVVGLLIVVCIEGFTADVHGDERTYPDDDEYTDHYECVHGPTFSRVSASAMSTSAEIVMTAPTITSMRPTRFGSSFTPCRVRTSTS